MAHVDTDGVILAVAVAVTEQTDLSSVGRHFFNVDSELVLSSSFLFPVDGVLYHLVVEGALVMGT